MDSVPLLHIRIMLAVDGGAIPIWEFKAPCPPPIDAKIFLVRTIQNPELDLTGIRNKHYMVFHHEWVLAAGHEPDLQYSVDVFVNEAVKESGKVRHGPKPRWMRKL